MREQSLLRGRLPLEQPEGGYRTNADALWLASFARADKPARRLLDLGSGVGPVGIAIVVMKGARAATLLDVDEEVLQFASRNVRAAGLESVVDVVAADVANALPESMRHVFDLVVANPPYGVAPASRPSPDVRRARGRTGEPDTLRAFARAARSALGAGGRACFVYPAAELQRLLATLREVGLEPKRARFVHPLLDRPARTVLLEAKPGKSGGLRIDGPLIVMRVPGEYTDEARRILEGKT